jgi:YfiH family protein
VSHPPFDTLNLGRSTRDESAAVEENRQRMIDSLGLDPARLATAGQVHGVAIAEVQEPGFTPEVDGLLTRARGVVLAVTCADCLPIILVAPGAVAAVHCGWRGADAGIATAAVRALSVAAQVPPLRISAHLGPCIRSCCYEVGPEVADRFPAGVSIRAGDSIHLDLAAAARSQLLDAGLAPDSIGDVTACTRCEPYWYFSHRRDRGATGRHWAIAALRQLGEAQPPEQEMGAQYSTPPHDDFGGRIP